MNSPNLNIHHVKFHGIGDAESKKYWNAQYRLAEGQDAEAGTGRCAQCRGCRSRPMAEFDTQNFGRINIHNLLSGNILSSWEKILPLLNHRENAAGEPALKVLRCNAKIPANLRRSVLQSGNNDSCFFVDLDVPQGNVLMEE